MNLHIDPDTLAQLRQVAADRRNALDTAHDLDNKGHYNQASTYHDQAENLDRELAHSLIELLDLEGDEQADIVDGQGPVDTCQCRRLRE